MAVAARQPRSFTEVQRQPGPSGLADVLDVLLDKGLVIDVYLRVSLVGVELLTVDARIVIASVDTYLHFAEAVNRLDLIQNRESETLPEMFGDMSEKGAGGKTKGMLEGAKEALFGGGGDEDEDEDSGGGSSSRSRSSSRSSSSRKSASRTRGGNGRKSSSSRSRTRGSSDGRSRSSGSRGR